MGQWSRFAKLATGALFGAATIAAGCGSSNLGVTSGFFPDAGDASGKGKDATTGKNPDSSMLGHKDGGCVPSTCKELNANCGKQVTDPKCGGTVDCEPKAGCPEGTVCGGSTPNQCGVGKGGGDACAVKLTCASQGITCGVAGDGCGGKVDCGGCALPQTCGGANNGKQECGCTGLCADIPVCNGDAGGGQKTTTLTGKVYDPAGNYPLYNALVYVPNNPDDPALKKPFPAGITCDVCGATAAGDPLVSTNTGVDGTFTLTNIPAGHSIPLVVQLGRWRRQFTFDVTPCGTTTIPAQSLTMPKNHTEGDLPRIAIVSGAFDPLECMLLKIGIDKSEFGDPGGANYISFYTANDPDKVDPTTGAGATYDLSTPSQDALFAATGGPGGGPVINTYDMTMLECLGYAQTEPADEQAALGAYTAAGGRLFTSDFEYEWLYQNPAFESSAKWKVNATEPDFQASIGLLDGKPENPDGLAFRLWLENLGTVGDAAIGPNAFNDYEQLAPVFSNTTAVSGQTQQWIHQTNTTGHGSNPTIPIFFTFNTPIATPDSGISSANQCGRVAFSDWHAQKDILSGGTTFPAACPGGALTAQELMLEFLLFDLSACVQPYTPLCTAKTCSEQGIECGPAGDGCGKELQCGPCATGTCGGGGPGKCGSSATCVPETCSTQNIQCGPAGDGCGNALDCGNCPAGDICGLGGPGKCGQPAK